MKHPVPHPIRLTNQALWALLLMVLLLPGLWGCSGLRNDYPEKDLFRLSATLSDKIQDTRPGGHVEAAPSLLIQQLDISPEFETDALVYRIGKNRFRSDFYHSFAVPPARMVTDIVRETLFASGRFVPAGPNAIRGKRYQIRGKLIDLYADLRDKNRFTAAISLRLILETPAGGEPGMVLHKTYRQEILFAPLEPDRYIDSLNQGLARILADFIRDVEAAGIH